VIKHLYRVRGVVEDYSLLLVIGAVVALVWANYSPSDYRRFHEYVLMDHFFIGHAHVGQDGVMHRTLTLHYLVNDVLMPFFFAIAGKEIWEQLALRNGSMRGKKALVPLIATIGGMAGPIAVFFLGAYLYGPTVLAEVKSGWAVPTATDIAFSLLVARMVFGLKHPAVTFLLLLAIADDAGGLIILAIFYPSGALEPAWLLLSLAAVVAGYYIPRALGLTDKRRQFKTWLRVLPYAIAGAVSWYAFQESGIHPALGLLPIIPIIPHADNDGYVFDSDEAKKTDLLNVIEHKLKGLVQVILFFFGLMNAGVEFSSAGPATVLVLLGLLLGKPLGIFLFGFLGARVLGLGLPEGMNYRELFVAGVVAAIGFTVSLFVAAVAFPPGVVQDAAKMGAVLSFLAVPLAVVVAQMLRVKRLSS
jgi:Na+:H+ antiporter, NhaA family